MQCKDIPDKPILELLNTFHGVWATWFPGEYGAMKSILPAFPQDCPDKLVIAKMSRLIDRGLVDGCGCGCRGDYVITEKGRNMIGVFTVEL